MAHHSPPIERVPGIRLRIKILNVIYSGCSVCLYLDEDGRPTRASVVAPVLAGGYSTASYAEQVSAVELALNEAGYSSSDTEQFWGCWECGEGDGESVLYLDSCELEKLS